VEAGGLGGGSVDVGWVSGFGETVVIAIPEL